MARIVELNSHVRRLESELQSDRLTVVDTKCTVIVRHSCSSVCRTQLKEAQNRIAASNQATTCQICLTNKCDHVLVPCGHVVCGSCSTQLTK
jgi:hypothetical protein